MGGRLFRYLALTVPPVWASSYHIGPDHYLLESWHRRRWKIVVCTQPTDSLQSTNLFSPSFGCQHCPVEVFPLLYNTHKTTTTWITGRLFFSFIESQHYFLLGAFGLFPDMSRTKIPTQELGRGFFPEDNFLPLENWPGS